jgi:hypothetical protein
MGRLRSLLASFGDHRYGSRHLDSDSAKDLLLWLKMLKKAATGVSLNILVLRIPTHLYRCDACFHGIGGYSSQGRAWRFITPLDLQGRASINLLEFIGSVLGPWVDFAEGNLPEEASIFSQGDNTTAAAWLQKTNFFSSGKPAHLKVAHRLANLLLEANTQLVNDWIDGESNTLSDSLSRDTHLSLAAHTALLLSAIPEQIPDGFVISPLPDAISSWVGSILQLLPASREPCLHPTRSKLVSGTAGSSTSAPSTAQTTPSSSPSTPPTMQLTRLKPIIVSGFAQALRTGQLQTRNRQEVAAGTVKGDIGSLVQAFRASRRPDPTRDPDGKLSCLLSWQFAGFASFDPPAAKNPSASVASNSCARPPPLSCKHTQPTSQLAPSSSHVAPVNTSK